MNERRVVITGIGVLSPLGNDLESTWEGLKAGKSGETAEVEDPSEMFKLLQVASVSTRPYSRSRHLVGLRQLVGIVMIGCKAEVFLMQMMASFGLCLGWQSTIDFMEKARVKHLKLLLNKDRVVEMGLDNVNVVHPKLGYIAYTARHAPGPR